MNCADKTEGSNPHLKMRQKKKKTALASLIFVYGLNNVYISDRYQRYN